MNGIYEFPFLLNFQFYILPPLSQKESATVNLAHFADVFLIILRMSNKFSSPTRAEILGICQVVSSFGGKEH